MPALRRAQQAYYLWSRPHTVKGNIQKNAELLVYSCKQQLNFKYSKHWELKFPIPSITQASMWIFFLYQLSLLSFNSSFSFFIFNNLIHMQFVFFLIIILCLYVWVF